MSKGLPLNVIYAGARCVKLMRISILLQYEQNLLRRTSGPTRTRCWPRRRRSSLCCRNQGRDAFSLLCGTGRSAGPKFRNGPLQRSGKSASWLRNVPRFFRKSSARVGRVLLIESKVGPVAEPFRNFGARIRQLPKTEEVRSGKHTRLFLTPGWAVPGPGVGRSAPRRR